MDGKDFLGIKHGNAKITFKKFKLFLITDDFKKTLQRKYKILRQLSFRQG